MKRMEHAHLLASAGTHAGMRGKVNEDRFAVTAFQMEDRRKTPVLLAVLCDGIGGHRAGEVAAEIAVNTISEQIAGSDGEKPVVAMRHAVIRASQEIYTQAQKSPEKAGMGATCAVAQIVGNHLYTATVGDSRIYYLHENSIRQLNTDHTWIQEALAMGIIQPDQVEGHPNAHVIRRYLGSPNAPLVDFRMRLVDGETDDESEANQGKILRPGDRLLLCSDGLSDLVKADEILAAFTPERSLDETIQALIDLANQRGGHDNITIVVLEIPRRSETRRKAAGSLARWLVAILIAAGVVAALTLGFLWLRQRSLPTPTPTVNTPAATLNLPALPQNSPMPSLTPGKLTVTAAPFAVEKPTAETGAVSPTLTPWPTHTRNP